MPTIVLRGLEPALVAAVRAEAQRHGVGLREMTIALLEAALMRAEEERRTRCGKR